MFLNICFSVYNIQYSYISPIINLISSERGNSFKLLWRGMHYTSDEVVTGAVERFLNIQEEYFYATDSVTTALLKKCGDLFMRGPYSKFCYWSSCA